LLHRFAGVSVKGRAPTDPKTAARIDALSELSDAADALLEAAKCFALAGCHRKAERAFALALAVLALRTESAERPS
jgi:hypothetical protein